MCGLSSSSSAAPAKKPPGSEHLERNGGQIYGRAQRRRRAILYCIRSAPSGHTHTRSWRPPPTNWIMEPFSGAEKRPKVTHTHEHNRHNSGCHDAGRLGMEFFRLPSGRSQQTTLCAAFGRPLLALARAGQLAEGWPEAGQRLDKKRYDLCRQLARHQLFAGRALPPRQTFFKASRGRPKRITTPRFLPGAKGFRSLCGRVCMAGRAEDGARRQIRQIANCAGPFAAP